jgi:hypothetical protein
VAVANTSAHNLTDPLQCCLQQEPTQTTQEALAAAWLLNDAAQRPRQGVTARISQWVCHSSDDKKAVQLPAADRLAAAGMSHACMHLALWACRRRALGTGNAPPPATPLHRCCIRQLVQYNTGSKVVDYQQASSLLCSAISALSRTSLPCALSLATHYNQCTLHSICAIGSIRPPGTAADASLSAGPPRPTRAQCCSQRQQKPQHTC